MIEISLYIRCESAESDAGQRAQRFADETCARVGRELRALLEQGALTITQSVTVTQSIVPPPYGSTVGTSEPNPGPRLPSSKWQPPTPERKSRAFQGPSLDEPAAGEPALPPPAADELAFGDLTPQEHLISTLKQLLIDAEEVARRRGDPSLCDSITLEGKPYPSQQILEVLTAIDNEGYEPL